MFHPELSGGITTLTVCNSKLCAAMDTLIDQDDVVLVRCIIPLCKDRYLAVKNKKLTYAFHMLSGL